MGEHQRTPKDKEGEGVKNLPSHATSSQKDVSINMEINTILSTSSQKDLDIEKSSNPGAQNTEGVTKAKTITPYVRKKKGVKSQPAHGEHTQHILETSSLEKVLPSSTLLLMHLRQMLRCSPTLFLFNLLLHILILKFLLIFS